MKAPLSGITHVPMKRIVGQHTDFKFNSRRNWETV